MTGAATQRHSRGDRPTPVAVRSAAVSRPVGGHPPTYPAEVTGPRRLAPAGSAGSGAARADETSHWQRALASLGEVALRAELSVAEEPAPTRLAPHSVALGADVGGDSGGTGGGLGDGDRDSGGALPEGSGRFVLLHDPAGQDAWGGTFRVVAFVKADLEPEMAADPMLTEVGWAWLSEALERHGAAHAHASGTVTRTASESFGDLAARHWSGTLEIRASWTPLDDRLGPHLEAWADLLGVAVGLPPQPVLPAGVSALAPGRRPTV